MTAVRRHPSVLILGERGTGKGLLARAVLAPPMVQGVREHLDRLRRR